MSEAEQDSLFEVISGDEFRKESISRTKRDLVTEPRIQTVWFTLPTIPGWCTVVGHKETQKMLSPEQIEIRKKYPVRHVFEIREGLFVCRDCFVAGTDKV
jgi:hypothetical protein